MNKKYVVGSIFSFVICVSMIEYVSARLGGIRGVEFSLDPHLSDLFHQKITEGVTISSLKEVSAIINHLYSYPCVKDVTCTIYPHKTAYFSIEAYKPWFQINKQLFLENGQMCDPSLYEVSCACVPTIHAKPEITCEQLYAWLEMMPVSVARSYDIWIESGTLVLLKEKKSGLGIKCLPEQLAQAAVIERVYDILRRSARDNNTIADMRFDEHVIVRTERGWDHGTCIS